jgi:hypothetical protein
MSDSCFKHLESFYVPALYIEEVKVIEIVLFCVLNCELYIVI